MTQFHCYECNKTHDESAVNTVRVEDYTYYRCPDCDENCDEFLEEQEPMPRDGTPIA